MIVPKRIAIFGTESTGKTWLAERLAALAPDPLFERLERGYEPDPRLERFTGWPIERIAGAETPKYDQQLFPSAQSGLCAYPAEPRPAKKTKA